MRLQLSVAAMAGLVACVALNFWLFRLGPFWGIIGLGVTKHVIIAQLCLALGVDKRPRGTDKPRPTAASATALAPAALQDPSAN